MSDRAILEKSEARVLVHGFIYNNNSQEWLTKALTVSRKVYGAGSEERIKEFMRQIWKNEIC